MTEPPSPAAVAVVLGGSHTGMLAARALAGHADRVVVVERDDLPVAPAPRKGLPQARHAHMLWSGGARAMEQLLPGITRALLAAGARRAPVTTDMVVLSPHGWFRRWPESHHVLLASRDLLDATVRARVLADDRIELLAGTEVLGLTGDARAVTGVRVRERDGRERTMAAGLVVDATGRGSGAPRWLAGLGLPAPEQREIDSGLVYASRLYLAPEPAREGFPVVNVQSDPRDGGPGRAGFLLPIEDGRWIVTLNGTRGGEPGAAADAFLPFAREKLRHPLIGDLIAGAEPLSDVAVTRTTVNRRHFYERMPAWPEHFTVLGDAVAAYNPLYGHGLAVGAQSALLLRELTERHGFGSPGLSRRVQKAVARPVGAAWDLAGGQDVFYPGATREGPTRRDRLVAAYVSRLLHTATGNGRIARRVTDVTSLERRAEVLLRPSVLLAALAGPLKPPLTEPPLTAEELKKAGLE
ncbi:2-polyprenyl-6-methoxyphenol hydroxylase-like FAD-dependent oxidoreductase [Streptomyces sp. SAI-135]|uniref:FAD-dependent oxidoreductase n=1 Tax=unclassified Streptomyces TaxID=2593676 RepID=UPI0024759B1F|nr:MULTISPECIES: FAD-dependent oxidoreductase [unclassified Streptomyces]MDH6519290.1 2-polyprenyl-6-methoxyphenol hydroxylase-like FAD-dependent oxidoreductase [Streptomyces sp. SAI-090]MDH6551514.1 2-polyprenyl-6-methoxyphenol hydroxylase-like FAD-dependent oxidoreductase [Streptomyces sp. SAI-041]MDH6570594.1 2-polyprenyl-6-methoxyphenol hydroxylase-like FAD-dependent oxidoreductase [Streptomyces sp. SAI-117]MDH6584430.1 2-polyprenyl-6-methoxyphenol hydroxylase-like FAD-dependent oxidoreduct